MPEFNRPEHPDFWLLSQTVIDNDALSDNGGSFDGIISEIVDVESLLYMGDQRMLRSRAMLGRMDDNTKACLIAMFIDGFMIGAKYQKLKGEK